MDPALFLYAAEPQNLAKEGSKDYSCKDISSIAWIRMAWILDKDL
jgi:hypothetical protein